MCDNKTRCPWPGTDPLYVNYHDKVWGRPVYDDRELFEKLCLDGQQAGLAWITILRKLEGYRRAYDNFNPELIALYDDEKIEALMQDKGIVRNRLKVQSIIKNARAFLNYQQEQGSFSEFLWSFVGGSQKVNQWHSMEQVPATSPESDAMSRALKQIGFNFVGSTICYAFMQAVGMVNDHLVDCHCYQVCMEKTK
ncbi:DNA-3-methyladenine glycosylase I [Corallincola platygyrae]|uniref:DNA-3-methyladenine glycosylase I n=1 Tax=Corallincola platygyrae TaxID=1193278 RepID=A0ABW4XKW0_9GAMM